MLDIRVRSSATSLNGKQRIFFFLFDKQKTERAHTKWHDQCLGILSSVWQSDCLHLKRIWFVCIGNDWVDVGGTICRFDTMPRKRKVKDFNCLCLFYSRQRLGPSEWRLQSCVPNNALFQFLFSSFSQRKLILFPPEWRRKWDNNSHYERFYFFFASVHSASLYRINLKHMRRIVVSQIVFNWM